MTQTPREAAEAAVDGIISDLSDRRGLRHKWDQIDDDIRAEIKASWAEIVVAALPLPAAPSEPTAEGQDDSAQLWKEQAFHWEKRCAQQMTDLARMKAAMERCMEALNQANTVLKPVANVRNVSGKVVICTADLHHAAREAITTVQQALDSLKRTSP